MIETDLKQLGVIQGHDAMLVPVTEVELAQLIRQSVCGRQVNLAFGTGGVALMWKHDDPMPWCVELLGRMRGVLNENCQGAGI